MVEAPERACSAPPSRSRRPGPKGLGALGRAEGIGALGHAEGIACMAIVLMNSVSPRSPRGGPAPSRSAHDERCGTGSAGRISVLGAQGAPLGELGGDQVEGRRAVLELLSVGRRNVRRVLMADEQDPSPQLDRIEQLATQLRVPIETVPRARLDAQARTDAPQGVVALARPLEPVSLEELCRPGKGGTRRSCWSRRVLPTRATWVLSCAAPSPRGSVASCCRATARPGSRPPVTKTAAGAIEHLPFAVVGGVPAALSELRRPSACGRSASPAEAAQSLYDLPLGEGPVALVVGSEEKGLAPLVRRRCDAVAAIPQHGALPSLNVGVAGAVACFEVARQRATGSGTRAD